MLCARAILGTSSIASAVMPASVKCSIPFLSFRASSTPTTTAPLCKDSMSLSDGLATHSRRSIDSVIWCRFCLMVALASEYCWSVNPALSPACVWIMTLCPAFVSRFTDSGVAGTRLSPCVCGFRTPIFIFASYDVVCW